MNKNSNDIDSVLAAIGRRKQKRSEVNSILQRSHFVYRRRLQEYGRLLGQDFLGQLRRLKSHQLWMDSGLGAGCAIRDYFGEARRPAQVTGVCFRYPGTLKEKRSLESYGVKLLVGQKIERRGLRQLGRPHLISDVYGPLTYSADLGKVLRLYFRSLKVGGFLYTVDATKLAARSARCLVIDGNRILTFGEFLKTLKGIRVRETRRGSVVSLRIQKTNGKVHLPRLKFLGQYAARIKVYQILG